MWQDSIRHMQELRGGWWQYGEGGGGGMERVAAVAHRGLAEGKGRWHASVEAASVWASQMRHVS